jgi:hypothetical protein
MKAIGKFRKNICVLQSGNAHANFGGDILELSPHVLSLDDKEQLYGK